MFSRAMRTSDQAPHRGKGIRRVPAGHVGGSAVFFEQNVLGDAEASKKVTEPSARNCKARGSARKTSASVGELLTPEGNASSTGKSAVAGSTAIWRTVPYRRHRARGHGVHLRADLWTSDQEHHWQARHAFSAVDTFLKTKPTETSASASCISDGRGRSSGGIPCGVSPFSLR